VVVVVVDVALGGALSGVTGTVEGLGADDFDKQAERRTTGPVTLAPGHDDQGAIWPETRDEAVNTHYGVVLPPRGHLALDLMRPATRPADHNFMTLASAGTPGNTKLALRILGDMRP
jgi:hypothetical protein